MFFCAFSDFWKKDAILGDFVWMKLWKKATRQLFPNSAYVIRECNYVKYPFSFYP